MELAIPRLKHRLNNDGHGVKPVPAPYPAADIFAATTAMTAAWIASMEDREIRSVLHLVW
jgi:hypothetical protein